MSQWGSGLTVYRPTRSAKCRETSLVVGSRVNCSNVVGSAAAAAVSAVKLAPASGLYDAVRGHAGRRRLTA